MRDLRAPKRALRAIPKLASLQKRLPNLPSGGTPEPIQSSESVKPLSIRAGFLARILIGAGGTALWVTCLSAAYGPASVGDMRATTILLVAGWAFAMGAFILSEIFGALPKGHRLLLGVFFGVALAAVSALWGSLVFQPAHTAIKEEAHFVLSANPLARGDDRLVVTGVNKGDIIARAGSRVGSFFTISDHALSQTEEDQGFRNARNALPPIGSGIEFFKDSSRSVNIPITVTPEQYDSIISGAKYLYVFAVMGFTDELTPPGRQNLSTLCVHFHTKLSEPLICFGHNESRLLD